MLLGVSEGCTTFARNTSWNDPILCSVRRGLVLTKMIPEGL